MDNKGAILLETVISIGFISVILLSSFVVVNSIMNKNSKLYNDQMERRTINSVYSKIANDFYKYNIKSLECHTETYCDIQYYSTDVDEGFTRTLIIYDYVLNYNGYNIPSNSAVKFNSVSSEIEDNILILSITYNDIETMKIYSINYKGE